MAAEALIADSRRALAVNWRIWDFIAVFRLFAPDWLTVHRFLLPSRGEVTKFVKPFWNAWFKDRRKEIRVGRRNPSGLEGTLLARPPLHVKVGDMIVSSSGQGRAMTR